MAKDYEIIEKFECADCGEEHDEYSYAEECCPREPIENTYYKCETCEKVYQEDEEDKVKECCADEIKEVLNKLNENKI